MATGIKQDTSGKEPYVTKKELCAYLGFRDVKSITNLMRKKILPYYDLGYKTVRFKLSECEAALAKSKVKAAGEGR